MRENEREIEQEKKNKLKKKKLFSAIYFWSVFCLRNCFPTGNVEDVLGSGEAKYL